MLECHRRQRSISEKVTTEDFRNLSHSDSRKQAALKLQNELNFLSSSFAKWISAHEFYLQSINNWLRKCVSMVPTRQRSSKKRREPFDPVRHGAPPIFATCQKWLEGLNRLPTKEVNNGVKGLASLLTEFMPHKEKKNKLLNVSPSGKLGGTDGLKEELLRNGSSANRNLGTQGLCPLEAFLKQMVIFSAESVELYSGLRNTTDNTIKEHWNSWE